MANETAISSQAGVNGGEGVAKTLAVARSGVRNTNDPLKLTLAAVDDAITGMITVPLANVVVRGVGTAAKLVELNARYGKPDANGCKVLEMPAA